MGAQLIQLDRSRSRTCTEPSAPVDKKNPGAGRSSGKECEFQTESIFRRSLGAFTPGAESAVSTRSVETSLRTVPEGTRPFRSFSGFIDTESSSPELLSVERLNRLLSRGIVHFDESEAFRSVSFSVDYEFYQLYFSEGAEKVSDFLFCCTVRQIAYINAFHFVMFSVNTANRHRRTSIPDISDPANQIFESRRSLLSPDSFLLLSLRSDGPFPSRRKLPVRNRILRPEPFTRSVE